MEFEQACSEIEYILKNLDVKDKEKIPQSVIDFFSKNKSITYRVKLTTDKSLKEQNLKEETKAFLKILYAKYFAKETERQEFENMLKTKETETKQLTIYKENKIMKLLKKLSSFFKKGI